MTMTLMLPRRAATALLLAIPALAAFTVAGRAHAAGFDCKRAASPSERAICADPALRQLDAELGDAYAQVLAAAPDLRDSQRSGQREWLRERDQCGADARCLAAAYERRLASFARPDPVDMAALNELHQAVEAARRASPDLALERVLERLKVATGTTSFDSGEPGAEALDQVRLPKARPPGVSVAEWRALQASGLDVRAESGQARFLLLDIDGDGLRDLVVERYTGGTGMFWSTGAVRQADGRFGPPRRTPADPDESDAGWLYDRSERPSGSDATWIRLHGRVYAAYRESRYGIDQVLLLRPWSGTGQVPRLVIRYRYRLAVPAVQPSGEREGQRLDPALLRSLNAAVALASPVAPGDAARPARPICPLPPDAPDDVREASTRYGFTHYTMEAVDDVPVRIGKQCYIGQVRNVYGGYSPNEGLGAELCLRKPEELEPAEDNCYAVRGPRTIIGIDAGAVPYH